MATLEKVQHQEDLLKEASPKFKVIPDDLPETAERFFKEWKQKGKDIEKLKEYRSVSMAEELLPGEKKERSRYSIGSRRNGK